MPLLASLQPLFRLLSEHVSFIRRSDLGESNWNFLFPFGEVGDVTVGNAPVDCVFRLSFSFLGDFENLDDFGVSQSDLGVRELLSLSSLLCLLLLLVLVECFKVFSFFVSSSSKTVDQRYFSRVGRCSCFRSTAGLGEEKEFNVEQTSLS